MQLNLNNLNFKVIGIICAMAVAYGVFVGFIITPQIMKLIIKMQVRLKPGNLNRDLWNETPFPLNFHLYVFNITNPDEFINGGIARVQQIGPYHFDLWKDKVNQEDDEAEDSVTFDMRNTWIFRPDLSNGLDGSEIVLMPHPLVEMIGISIQRNQKPLLNMIAKGLQNLFADSFSALYRGKVMDIFFNGIPVNCDTEDFASKAICSAFVSGEVKNAVQHNDTMFLFSYLAYQNHTGSGRLTVCRGMKNIHKLGKVIRVNDDPDWEVWNEGKCNELGGSDTTIFPPFLKRGDRLGAAILEVCRSVSAVYGGKTKYAGLPASRYTFDLGDIKNEPENWCLCGDNPPDDCPVKGTMNLAPCLENAPIVASLPHFLHGDDSLFENVEGLHPEEEKHLNIFDFELISGTPFKSAKRLQFNLDQEPVPEIEPLSKLRKMIVPLFWVEEGVSINKTFVNMVRPIFIVKAFNQVTRWLSIVFGALGFAGSMFMYTQRQTGSAKVSSVKSVTNSENKIAPDLGKDSRFDGGKPFNIYQVSIPGGGGHLNGVAEASEKY